jgi:hypothetical protein
VDLSYEKVQGLLYSENIVQKVKLLKYVPGEGKTLGTRWDQERTCFFRPLGKYSNNAQGYLRNANMSARRRHLK